MQNRSNVLAAAALAVAAGLAPSDPKAQSDQATVTIKAVVPPTHVQQQDNATDWLTEIQDRMSETRTCADARNQFEQSRDDVPGWRFEISCEPSDDGPGVATVTAEAR